MMAPADAIKILSNLLSLALIASYRTAQTSSCVLKRADISSG
jgi:hypothetical protein